MSTRDHQYRILVVDDTVEMRQTISQILLHAGFQVETANDGGEALERQAQNPFPLIITDIFMPDRDGLEVLRAIRTKYPETRIIVVTGGGPMDLELCLSVASKLGACQVMAKPFRPLELLVAVDKALGRENPA